MFRAIGGDDQFLAVKIYRTATATYRNYMKYITGDPRFRQIPRNRRRLVHIWAQKEYKNLHRLHHAGIRVPEAVAQLQNVLIMSYIGDENSPAPRLREVPQEATEDLIDDLCKVLRNIYRNANMVHGDFSEYNILMMEDGPVVIDVAQAVLREHPMAEELLERDVSNLVRMGRHAGVDRDIDELLGQIREI